MTDPTPTRAEVEAPVYLISKAGAYYRPNSCGYTISAIQAGRYTLSQAEKFTHPNGPDGPRDDMNYIHEDNVRDDDWRAFKALRERAEAAEQRVNELEGLCMQLEAEAGNAAAQLAAALAEIAEDDADLNRIADERRDGPFVPVELVALNAARRAEAAAWNGAVAKCAEVARRNGAFATALAIRKLARPE